MKKIMLLSLCSALLMAACHSSDPTPAIDLSTVSNINPTIVATYKNSADGTNWFIVGDTIIPKSKLQLLPTSSEAVNLGDLAKTDGTAVRYFALGSSITAGVREGGLFLEGQLTSFPNLLARQMKLANFNQPL